MRGFTLIEVLITVAIITAVSAAGYVAFSKFKGSQAVELTMNEITAVIKDVQKRAVTQQDGKQWGLRFTNSTSTTHSYQVWSGPSYASGTISRTYYLGRGTLFGNPADDLNVDEIFSAISGKLLETRVISLINRRKDGVVGDIILTSRGAITTRKESGLVGYWHFDESTATTTYDASGFANAGTLTNGPAWQSASNCKAGTCLSFDGTNDYVNVIDSASLDITGAITVSAWVYADSYPSTYPTVVAKGNSASAWELDVKNDGTIEWEGFIGGTQRICNGGSFNLNQWVYIVGLFDGSDMKIFVNGSEVKSCSFPGNFEFI